MPTNRLLEKEEVLTYAKLLLENTYAQGNQEAALEVRSQLANVVAICNANADLQDALYTAHYNASERFSIAQGVFADCNMVLREVLSVMAERGDLRLLNRVAQSYSSELQTQYNVNVVDVTTAVPLDDALREKIIQKVQNDLGGNVVLQEHVDTSILGGIVMSTQGKRIDASVASQIERARSVLKQSTDGGEE